MNWFFLYIQTRAHNFTSLDIFNGCKDKVYTYCGPSGDWIRYFQIEALLPASCQLSSTFVSCHRNCVKKYNPNDMANAAMDNWQPIWNAQVLISTPVCVYIELHPGNGNIYISYIFGEGEGYLHKMLKHSYNIHKQNFIIHFMTLIFKLIGPWEISTKFWICNFPANFSDWWLRYLLQNCTQMNATGPYWW